MRKISINTHAYDKIIGPLYKKYLETDSQELNKPPDFNTTVSEIRKYINVMANNKMKPYALRMLNLLVNNKNGNYDPKNQIHVNDLLPRTWRFIRHYEKDGIECFIEQIADISKGSCSQGRTTRIFQFYEYHMLLKGEIYKMEKIH